MNDQKIQNLERRVAELESWVSEKKLRQLSYPLDAESKQTLSKDFPLLKQVITYYGGASGTAFNFYMARVDDKDIAFSITTRMISFTVNPTTNVITTDAFANIQNGSIVMFYTTGSVPGGLDNPAIDYYVVNASGNSFQVSSTFGGAAIDITSAGTGNNYVEVIGGMF